MIIKFFLFLLPFSAFAAGVDDTAALLNAAKPTETYCATSAFATGLKDNAFMIDENDSETNVKMWVYDVFQSPEVLTEVLACPEILDAEDTDTIHFMPIKHTFPNGREIVINYETQPKVLEQRLLLAAKTELPTDDISPEVSNTDTHATWVNVDPAWYGIMVVQAGALDDFVGPGNNNTISMDYIQHNINKFYPRDMNGVCSTRAGMGARANNSMVNYVIHEKTAKHDGDKNNYYVAGDINLKWVSYGEIALEVVMTIITWGGAAAVTGAIKGARLAKTSAKIVKNMRALTKAANVQKYIRNADKVNKARRSIENADRFAKSMKNVSKLEKNLAKATKGTKRYERLENQLDAARKMHSMHAARLGKDADNIKSLNDLDKLDNIKKLHADEIAKNQKEMSELAKTDKNVSEYVRQTDALRDLYKYANELKSIKKARTGNAFQRGWQGLKNARQSLRAANRGGKTLDRAERVARQGAKFVDKVGDISRIGRDATKIEKDLKSVDKYTDAARELEIVSQNHIDEIKRLTKEQQKALSKVDAQELEKMLQSEQDALNAMTKSREEITALEKELGEIGKIDKNSAKYKSLSKELETVKLRHAADAKKMVAAIDKVSGAINGFARKISNLGAAFRHSTGASATRDWLFHSTLRNASRITKGVEELAVLQFALSLIGDFYDYTHTSSDEYTNGIEMKPFLLLGADALEGYDNVVNYGMWLMWAGDSGYPEDDDAAYLQAMDFAQKFYQDLVETQEEQDRYACDVDIYVVRPIIRNPDTDHQALYWLIMNDIPWSTSR
jgi:hypothetical protein